MLQRGRSSATALEIVNRFNPTSPASIEIVKRLPAPDDFHDSSQILLWERIVSAYPADWFPPGADLLLKQLCRHEIHARQIAELLDRHDLDDLKDYERLLRMQKMETMTIVSLATKLKLTPQTLTNWRGNKKPGSIIENAPWEDEDDDQR